MDGCKSGFSDGPTLGARNVLVNQQVKYSLIFFLLQIYLLGRIQSEGIFGTEGLIKIEDVAKIFQTVALGLLHEIIFDHGVNYSAKVRGAIDVPFAQDHPG